MLVSAAECCLNEIVYCAPHCSKWLERLFVRLHSPVVKEMYMKRSLREQRTFAQRSCTQLSHVVVLV